MKNFTKLAGPVLAAAIATGCGGQPEFQYSQIDVVQETLTDNTPEDREVCAAKYIDGDGEIWADFITTPTDGEANLSNSGVLRDELNIEKDALRNRLEVVVLGVLGTLNGGDDVFDGTLTPVESSFEGVDYLNPVLADLRIDFGGLGVADRDDLNRLGALVIVTNPGCDTAYAIGKGEYNGSSNGDLPMTYATY